MRSAKAVAPQLPLEHPIGDAISIYLRRLGVFAAVVIAEVLLISFLLLVAQVQILPITEQQVQPTLEPEAIAIPLYTTPFFIDEFEAGISQRWIVLEGRPITTNGNLSSASGLLLMQLAAAPPPEYSVEFSIGSPSSEGAFIAWHINPSLRYNVTYTDQGAVAAWQSHKAEVWTDMEPETNIQQGAVFQIFASQDLFVTMSDGAPSSVFPFVDPSQETPFVLSVSEGVFIDAIRLVVP